MVLLRLMNKKWASNALMTTDYMQQVVDGAAPLVTSPVLISASAIRFRSHNCQERHKTDSGVKSQTIEKCELRKAVGSNPSTSAKLQPILKQ